MRNQSETRSLAAVKSDLARGPRPAIFRSAEPLRLASRRRNDLANDRARTPPRCEPQRAVDFLASTLVNGQMRDPLSIRMPPLRTRECVFW
jgi:hypothetical protein